jgi:hypothetical protein
VSRDFLSLCSPIPIRNLAELDLKKPTKGSAGPDGRDGYRRREKATCYAGTENCASGQRRHDITLPSFFGLLETVPL